VQVAAGSERLVGDSTGIVLLDAALMASQQVMIHGAALRLPQREAAIGLFAPSGAGKTTTSLALALQGFGFMADDASVLMPIGAASGTGPRIWGLPRALKVHRRTAGLLPQIGGLLGTSWDDEGEQVLERTLLQSAIDVLPPRPVSLAAFVVLGPRVSGQHRLGPMPKSELLVRVAADNIFRSRHGVLDEELGRYRRMAHAVAELPGLELNVGTDLDSLSEFILAALG
jgi:hypothetical protein